MRRGRRSRSLPDGALVAAALDAMDADSLRELIRETLPWLDDRTHSRLAGEIIDRAARTADSDWTPDAPADDAVAEMAEFASEARHAGYADPSEVDAYLRQGMNAFLAKDYRTAVRVFHDLVVPISEAEIDIGQHELVDEVLSVDLAECSAQYVAAVYMISTRSERAGAVKAAIDDIFEVGYFRRPLHELERVAIEPLPDFDEFLRSWNDLVSDLAQAQPMSEWDTGIDHWRREVTQRLHGDRWIGGHCTIDEASGRLPCLVSCRGRNSGLGGGPGRVRRGRHVRVCRTRRNRRFPRWRGARGSGARAQ